MPSVFILTLQDRVPPGCHVQLAGALSLPISEIQKRVAEERPLLEASLFHNDHDEQMARARRAITILTSHSVIFTLFEAQEGDTFEEARDSGVDEISAEDLDGLDERFQDELKRSREEDG